MITANYLRQLLTYDPDAGTWQWNKYPAKGLKKKEAGTLITEGYIGITIDHTRYLAHRLAFLYMSDKWPMHEIDHINGNRTDNRWNNLREATDTQTARNRKPHSNKKIPLKGVYLLTARGKKRKNPYGAVICIDGKQIHLGVFSTPHKAHQAYISAAKQHFGQFARIK